MIHFVRHKGPVRASPHRWGGTMYFPICAGWCGGPPLTKKMNSIIYTYYCIFYAFCWFFLINFVCLSFIFQGDQLVKLYLPGRHSLCILYWLLCICNPTLCILRENKLSGVELMINTYTVHPSCIHYTKLQISYLRWYWNDMMVFINVVGRNHFDYWSLSCFADEKKSN